MEDGAFTIGYAYNPALRVDDSAREPRSTVPKQIPRAEDKHVLYLASVQCPEADVEFFQRVFKQHAGRPLRFIREDFCGSAALCAEWVKTHPENRALGVDYHEPTLDWGKDNIMSLLDDEARSRVELICDDVRNITGTGADLLCAQNFSYWIFQERDEMLRYFGIARDSLAEDGLLVLDLLGGTASTEVDTEERRIEDGVRPDGTKVPPFTYIWDQHDYNPITGEMQCYIHFKMRGRKMNKAYSYKWRVWGLPEIRDILRDAGFPEVDVYTEGWDEAEDDTDGVFRKRKDFDHEGSYVAYLVAKPKR